MEREAYDSMYRLEDSFWWYVGMRKLMWDASIGHRAGLTGCLESWTRAVEREQIYSTFPLWAPLQGQT